MKKIFLLAAVVLAFWSCEKDDDNTDSNVPIVTFTPEFVVEMIPEDKGSDDDTPDRSINVIQGFAFFEDGWFTSQTSQSKYLIINYLGADGVSQFNVKLNVNSHAQDLSLEKINDNELYLYTSEGYFKDTDNTRGSGMVRLHVTLPPVETSGRDMSKLVVEVDKSYDLNYVNSTPTISEDNTKFAIRSNKTIHVLSKENIENGLFTDVVYRFELSNDQLYDRNGNTMWFQGIVHKDGLTYCLTGDNSVTTEKKLFVYDNRGVVVSASTFYFDDFGLEAEDKLEPESLSFAGDVLYLTMMTEKPDGASGNLKYLFKLNRIEE